MPYSIPQPWGEGSCQALQLEGPTPSLLSALFFYLHKLTFHISLLQCLCARVGGNLGGGGGTRTSDLSPQHQVHTGPGPLWDLQPHPSSAGRVRVAQGWKGQPPTLDCTVRWGARKKVQSRASAHLPAPVPLSCKSYILGIRAHSVLAFWSPNSLSEWSEVWLHPEVPIRSGPGGVRSLKLIFDLPRVWQAWLLWVCAE